MTTEGTLVLAEGVESEARDVQCDQSDSTCCGRCLQRINLIGGFLRVTITDCAAAMLMMVAILPLLGAYWFLGLHGYFGVTRIGFLIASICHTRLALARVIYENSGSEGLFFLLSGIVAFASIMGVMIKFCQVCNIEWGRGLLIKVAVMYGLSILPSNVYNAYVLRVHGQHIQEEEQTAALMQKALSRVVTEEEGFGWGRLIVVAIVTSAVGATVVVALDYLFYELPRFSSHCTVVQLQLAVSTGSQLAMHLMLKLVLHLYSTSQRLDFVLNAYVAVEVLAKISLYRTPLLRSVAIISVGQMAMELGVRSLAALEPFLRDANTFWVWSLRRALACDMSDDGMPPPKLTPDELQKAKNNAAIEARLMSIGEFCAHFSAICALVLWPTGVDSIYAIGAKFAIGLSFELVSDLCASAIGFSLGVDPHSVTINKDVWPAYKTNQDGWCANVWTTIATITCPVACVLATIWANEWDHVSPE